MRIICKKNGIDYTFLFAILISIFSCTKKDTSNVIPTIEYVGFYPKDDQIAELILGFRDGNGDLFQISDSKDPNVFITFEYKDTAGNFKPGLFPIVIPRPPLPDTIIYQKKIFTYTVYQPSDLTPNQYIQGKILITMVGWRPSNAYKKFRYVIYAVDRAGNKSNELYTPEISVNF
jgi:hypothetical protein